MAELNAEVLIIGAGAAGLAAAAELARSRRSVVVLEARDRIGGRCYTRQEPGLPIPVELGAEFIHGRSPPIFALLKKAGIAALDSSGTHWVESDGELRARDNLFPQIKRAMRKPNTLHAQDVSFEDFLAKNLRPKLSADALAFARMLVEGYDAADRTRISALEVVNEWTQGGGADIPSFRPLGGYGALMGSLAQSRRFSVSAHALQEMRALFTADRADEQEAAAEIRAWMREADYCIDPHTAVALAVAEKETRDPAVPMVVLSTAHPAKFPDAVKAACGVAPALPEWLADLPKREERVTVLPVNQAAIEKFVVSASRAAREGAAA